MLEVQVIDWKAVCDEKSAELRLLYAEIAQLTKELGQCRHQLENPRQGLELAFLRAESALLKHDLKAAQCR